MSRNVKVFSHAFRRLIGKNRLCAVKDQWIRLCVMGKMVEFMLSGVPGAGYVGRSVEYSKGARGVFKVFLVVYPKPFQIQILKSERNIRQISRLLR